MFLCLLCSRYSVLIDIMNIVLVMQLVLIVCMNLVCVIGLNSMVVKFIIFMCMVFGLKIVFVGFCIQLLVIRIYIVDRLVFRVISQVMVRCLIGVRCFQLKKNRLMKVVFRKNVIRFLIVSGVLKILLMQWLQYDQFMLNWNFIMMLVVMLMVKLMLNSVFQNRVIWCQICLWVMMYMFFMMVIMKDRLSVSGMKRKWYIVVRVNCSCDSFMIV